MSIPATTIDDSRLLIGEGARYETARRLFKAGILLAMTVPMFIYVAHTFFTASALWKPWYFLIPFIGGLSGTHVFATTYLYVQPGNFRGVPHKFVLLYAAPLAIIALNIYATTLMPLDYLFWFLTFYGFYVLFHFGRQNLGVLSFASLSSARRPIHKTEKLILNGVVACGMFAAPKLLEVGLLMNATQYAPYLAPLKPVIQAFYFVGGCGYVIVMAAAVYHFFMHRKAYDRYTAAIFWLCVVWYLPLYTVLQYPLLSFALFTTAHGLQYLVFLGMHVYVKSTNGLAAKSQQRTLVPKALAVAPIAILLASIYAGHYIWTNSPVLFSSGADVINALAGHEGVARFGAGLVAGITLAHYWVDQFIWRFKSPERRSWLIESYPFLALPKK